MAKDIDVTQLEPEGLRNMIANYRAKGLTDAPKYIEVLRELELKTGKGLNFETSLAVITEAAKERRFLSYRELADASGVTWSKANLAIGGHLGRLAEFAHARKLPMLSAIVVNKPNVKTGKMEPDALKDFVSAARDLKYTVTDEQEFLQQQQEEVFRWGSAQAA